MAVWSAPSHEQSKRELSRHQRSKLSVPQTASSPAQTRALENQWHALGRVVGIVAVAFLLVMFSCLTVSAQTSHVHLELGSAHAQTMEAIGIEMTDALLDVLSTVTKMGSQR
jgi:hypothetical protein